MYVPSGLISPLAMKVSVRKMTAPFGAGSPSVNVTFPVRRTFLPHPMATRQINKQSKKVYFFMEFPLLV